MSLDLDEMDSDLSEIISDLPVTFTSSANGATEFVGTKTNRLDTEELEQGGHSADFDFILICRTAVFTGYTVPTIGSKITIAGVAYRIENNPIADEPSGKEIQFRLKSSKK